MDGAFRHRSECDGGRGGKITRALAVIAQYGEALEADCEVRGISLASLSLRRVALLVEALLQTPGTCLYRAAGGDEWTLTDHLLALVHDQLAVANWQRSKDGAKGRNRPKPLSPLRKPAGARYGKTDKSPDEVKALLARYGPAPT